MMRRIPSDQPGIGDASPERREHLVARDEAGDEQGRMSPDDQVQDDQRPDQDLDAPRVEGNDGGMEVRLNLPINDKCTYRISSSK